MKGTTETFKHFYLQLSVNNARASLASK